jgi:hypothetical protein
MTSSAIRRTADLRLFGGSQRSSRGGSAAGFPAAIAKAQKPDIVPTATSSGRRTALANWIASPTTR